MRSFNQLVEDGKRKYGDRFSASGLAQQFIPYFENGKRIKVDLGHGEVLTGTVGVTTGWIPSFLLMRTSRSIGSPWLLHQNAKVIEVTKYQGRSNR